MKIFIRVSNTIKNLKDITNAIDMALKITNWHIGEIVIGGFDESDLDIAYLAKSSNTPIKVIQPKYKIFGKKSEYMKNIQIIDYVDAIIIIARGDRIAYEKFIDLAKKKTKGIFFYDIAEKYHEYL